MKHMQGKQRLIEKIRSEMSAEEGRRAGESADHVGPQLVALDQIRDDDEHQSGGHDGLDTRLLVYPRPDHISEGDENSAPRCRVDQRVKNTESSRLFVPDLTLQAQRSAGGGASVAPCASWAFLLQSEQAQHQRDARCCWDNSDLHRRRRGTTQLPRAQTQAQLAGRSATRVGRHLSQRINRRRRQSLVCARTAPSPLRPAIRRASAARSEASLLRRELPAACTD